MNISTLQELISLSEKELHLELEKARKELTQIQLGVKTQHIKDSHKIHEMKRYIAQILTILKNSAKDALAKKS